MPGQLTEQQRFFITAVKRDHPTWGFGKMKEMFPIFFEENNVTQKKVSGLLAGMKVAEDQGMPQQAHKRKEGTGKTKPVSSAKRQQVLALMVSDKATGRRHMSQRQAAIAAGISKSTVGFLVKQSGLKCFRKVRGQVLTPVHRESRKAKCEAFLDRFGETAGPHSPWRRLWFSDEARFHLRPPVNSQNERIYREVALKTDLDEEDLVTESDSQGPSVLAYAAVSWYGKTRLHFLDQGKTVNQKVYRDEMLTDRVFVDICHTMIAAGKRDDDWFWQQDGATPHTAGDTVKFLDEMLGNGKWIRPNQWPAKSPDLNVMDYAIWGILQGKVAACRQEISSIDELKEVLSASWDAIPLETIQKACTSWRGRLRKCIEANGGHFEYCL